MYKRSSFLTTVLLLWIIVALFGLGACRATEQVHPEVVRIGAIYPLSGRLASTGQALKQAAELAAEIINSEYELDLPLAQSAGLPGLDGARVEVVFADHAGDPAQGSTEAQRLIEAEGVIALLGAYNSSVTASTSQTAEAAGLPFLNASSTSPILTERGYKWFVRTTADDAIFARNFFEFLQDVEERQGLATHDIAIVYENTLWGTGVSQQTKACATDYGFNVVADVPYMANTDSVEAEVRTLIAAGKPIVIQASYVSDAILFVQTYEELDFQPTALLAMDAGFISPGFVEAVNVNGDYILSREVWALDLGGHKPLVQQVDQLYFERYGSHMDGNTARVFTGLLVLAEAINRAGSIDPEAIRQALLATDTPGEQLIMPWEGIRFDADTGQNELARGIIVQMWDGVYHTVWPWDMASEELIWPMPE